MRQASPASFGLGVELVENLNRRTQHSMRFTNPDRKNTTLFSSNLHYEARPGEWEPQNLNFQLKGSDHVCDCHWFHTTVSDDGIAMLRPETMAGIRWLWPSRPTISAKSANYGGSGVKWDYQVGPHRLKLSGTVATQQGPQTYTFPYQPLGSASDFTIVDGRAEADGFHVGCPVIFGANRRTYVTSGWILLPRQRMAFTFDDTSLPLEAYPYVIDPTTTFKPDGTDGRDAGIDDRFSTTVFETGPFLTGDVEAASASAQRMVIKFTKLSTIFGDTVDDVILKLFEIGAAGAGNHTVEVRVLLQAWVEAQVTWDEFSSGNSWASAGASTNGTDRRAAVSASNVLDGTAAGAYINFDGATLDADIQEILNETLTNNGHLISAEGVESQAGAEDYSQWRGSDDGVSERPQLVVVHSSPSTFTPKVMIF